MAAWPRLLANGGRSCVRKGAAILGWALGELLLAPSTGPWGTGSALAPRGTECPPPDPPPPWAEAKGQPEGSGAGGAGGQTVRVECWKNHRVP